jgi:GT2 family glycosyltransferase
MKSVVIIIVLYNENLFNSKTFISLNNAIGGNISNEFNFHLIIYDNSFESQIINEATNFNSFEYVHNSKNVGLAIAYNYALNYANLKGYSWLLLLDQDTILEDLFFINLGLDLNSLNQDYVAIVPTAFSNDKLLSPYTPLRGNRFLSIDKIKNKSNLQIYAVNSGTLISTKFLSQIGGFDEVFWLDYLDHWLFLQIHFNKKLVYVSKNVIEHDISILNYTTLNIKRYKNILRAESIFVSRYFNYSDIIFYKINLLFRLFKVSFIYKRFDLSFLIISKIFN